MNKLKSKVFNRLIDYAMKFFSIRFGAFAAAEYAILNGLQGSELWTHVAQAVGAAAIAIYYIWSETIRPTLSGKK